MTTRALLRNGREVSAEEYLYVMGPVFCVECALRMNFVNGQYQIRHFRHPPAKPGDPECPERIFGGGGQGTLQGHRFPEPLGPLEEGSEAVESLRVVLRMWRASWRMILLLPPLPASLYHGLSRVDRGELRIRGLLSDGSSEELAGFTAEQLRPEGPGEELLLPDVCSALTLTLPSAALDLPENWDAVPCIASHGSLFRLFHGEWTLLPPGSLIRRGEELLAVVPNDQHPYAQRVLGSAPGVPQGPLGRFVVGPGACPEQEQVWQRDWFKSLNYRLADPSPRLCVISWPLEVATEKGQSEMVLAAEDPAYIMVRNANLSWAPKFLAQHRGDINWSVLELEDKNAAARLTFDGPGAIGIELEPNGTRLSVRAERLPGADKIRALLHLAPRIIAEVEGAKLKSREGVPTLVLSKAEATYAKVRVCCEPQIPNGSSVDVRVRGTFPDHRYSPPLSLPLEEAGSAVTHLLAAGAQSVVVSGAGLGQVQLCVTSVAKRGQHLRRWRALQALVLFQDPHPPYDSIPPNLAYVWREFKRTRPAEEL